MLSLIAHRAGHINHSLFWKNLAPPSSEGKGHGGVLKDSSLKVAIVERWGSYEVFVKEFNTITAGIQGSGWGWLVRTYTYNSFILWIDSGSSSGL